MKCGDGELDEGRRAGQAAAGALLLLFLRLGRVFFGTLVLRRRLFVPTEEEEEESAAESGNRLRRLYRPPPTPRLGLMNVFVALPRLSVFGITCPDETGKEEERGDGASTREAGAAAGGDRGRGL